MYDKNKDKEEYVWQRQRRIDMTMTKTETKTNTKTKRSRSNLRCVSTDPTLKRRQLAPFHELQVIQRMEEEELVSISISPFPLLQGIKKRKQFYYFSLLQKICDCVFHCCSLFFFGFETWDLLLHKRDLSFAVLPVFVRQLLKFSRFLKTFSAATSSNTERFWAAVINSHAKFHFKRVFLGGFSFQKKP